MAFPIYKHSAAKPHPKYRLQTPDFRYQTQKLNPEGTEMVEIAAKNNTTG
jgi:hypothetical protein